MSGLRSVNLLSNEYMMMMISNARSCYQPRVAIKDSFTVFDLGLDLDNQCQIP